MSPALIIFIKNPVKGQVKTRLGRAIGDDAALEVYAELCRLTRDAVIDFPGKKYLYYSDEINSNDEWSSDNFSKHLQIGDDLGERIALAFENIFSLHDHIILIGSDCPYLKLDHLQNALTALKNVDGVIGPAKDGGYYLIGLRKKIPPLFINKNWSSETVLTETLSTLKELYHSYSLLETLEDIDTLSDWNRYQENEKLKMKNEK